MAYQINGTDLTMQPTEGRWVDRDSLGYDGNGRPIYPNPREFEMKFNLQDPADWYQLRTFFLSVGATGTSVVTLPEYGASAYQYKAYSGCVINEPQMGAYFEGYIQEAKVIVSKIITS